MAFNPLQNILGGIGARQQQDDRTIQLQRDDEADQYQKVKRFNELSRERKQAYFDDAVMGKSLLDSGDIQGLAQLQQNRLNDLKRIGSEDTTGTEMIMGMVQQGDFEGLRKGYTSAIDAGMKLGFIKNPTQKGTKQIEFESLVEIAEGDPKGETIKGKAALMDLGIMAKASKTAAERIAESPELERLVAEAAKNKAQATEEGKSSAQLKFKPQIQSAIKIAEAEASSRGEALTDLSKMQASMPGLESAVSQLRELSEISTSTLGGRFFDTMVKETGFGATKGGTARTKIIAIINNQMLPLLKDTFGGAMTEGEGERLAATMGDPDQTHEGRMAALDAFIDQKRRTISGLKNEVGTPNQAPPAQLSEQEIMSQYGL